MNTVNTCGRVVSVFVNITDEVQYFKNCEMVDYFTLILEDDVLKNGLEGESIDEVFGHFYQGRKVLIDTVSIKAPYNHHNQYLDLCLRYHDVFSKSKFDIGRTDVIEHMKSEDPIHIRQFRIPLEHRQTIYDLVDELLKKGAIEVSRSCFNSPISLVPKPHGHGMTVSLGVSTQVRGKQTLYAHS